MEKQKRYFVDERGGCIAVRDRTKTDPNYNGLHGDTEGVVKYWHGKKEPVKPCRLCGHVGDGYWTVSEKDRKEAGELRDQLNAETSEGVDPV